MAKAGIIKNPFRTALNKDDVISAVTVPVLVGQYVELGRKTVQAGVALALGYDSMSGQDAAAGRFYFDLRDNAASPGAILNGTLRIDVQNAQNRVQATIWEGRMETLRTSASDRRQQLPLPFINAVSTEDVSFVFMFKADASGTVGKVNSTVLIDATSFEAE